MSSASSSAQEAVALPDHIQRLLLDVRTHLVPQLKQAAGQGALDEAEFELHQGIARAEGALNDWSIDVQDLGQNANERQAWQQVLLTAKKDLSTLRFLANKSLVEAKAIQQNSTRQDARTALFAEMTTSQQERKERQNKSKQNQTADEQLMTASGDVTAALQRTVQLMSVELEKSSYSAQLLDESSVSIQQATVQYVSFTSLVASSRKLIASMERADMVDAILLLLSFLFFLGSITYILKVRIWDKGIGILSFFFRAFGLVSSTKSAADVKEKLLLAKHAAIAQAQKSYSSSVLDASSSVAAAAAAAASAAASAAAAASSSSLSSASSASSQSASEELLASVSASAAQTSKMIQDLDDEHLPDIVEKDTPLTVTADHSQAHSHDEL